jgi:hypothetical protein
MPLTRSFKELVERLAAADPDFEAALRRERSDATSSGEESSQGTAMTPARKALQAFAEAWTYPILGNEDVSVMKRLFRKAEELARDAATADDDPSQFAGWLEMLRDEARKGSNEWEDTLHAVTDYFGLSTDN